MPALCVILTSNLVSIYKIFVNLIRLSKRTECLGKKGFTVHGNTNVPVLCLASQERC